MMNITSNNNCEPSSRDHVFPLPHPGRHSLLMYLQYAVDNGNVSILDLKNDDFTDTDRIVLVVEEKDIPSLKRGFHRATEGAGERGETRMQSWREFAAQPRLVGRDPPL